MINSSKISVHRFIATTLFRVYLDLFRCFDNAVSCIYVNHTYTRSTLCIEHGFQVQTSYIYIYIYIYTNIYKYKKESITSYSSFTLKAIIRLGVVHEKISFMSVQI